MLEAALTTSTLSHPLSLSLSLSLSLLEWKTCDKISERTLGSTICDSNTVVVSLIVVAS